MADARDPLQHVRCAFCQVRIRCPQQLRQFHCPRCGKLNQVELPDAAASRVVEAKSTQNLPPPAAPADESEFVEELAAGSRAPAIVCWSVGILLGLLTAFLLSALKPTLGRGGLALVGGLAVLATVVLGAAYLALRWCERSFQGEPAQAFERLRNRSGMAFRIVGGAALLCGAIVVAECFGPDQGYFRRLTDGPVAQRPEWTPPAALQPAPQPVIHAVAKPPTPSHDFKPWSNVDIVVVNPAHRAVGIRNKGDLAQPEYEVVVKAADDSVLGVKRFAWDSKIPIWAADPAIARKLFDEFNEGQAVLGGRRDELAAAFRPKTFVPTGGAFISYFDTVNRLKRTGHLLKDQGDAFVFADLLPQRLDVARLKDTASDALPFRTELIRRADRVQPGTEQRDLNDIALRESTDFVDYCVYGALATLQNIQANAVSERDRITPHLYVDVVAEVRKDELASIKSEIADSRDQLRIELNQAFMQEQTPMRFLNLLNRYIGERERYADRMSSQATLRRQIEEDLEALRHDRKKLQRLVAVENTLASEIRRGLIRAGIKVVERSDRAREILMNKVRGNQWLRPDANTAVETNLVDATHTLMASIRKAESPGTYLVSMQLTNAWDGIILWEEVGSRTDRDPDGRPSTMRTTSASSTARGPELRGVWTTPSGVQLAFSEYDNTIRARLVSSNVLDAFELVGQREGSTVNVTSCAITMKQDPTRSSRPVKAELTILDANRIRIGCDAIQIDRRGREIGRTFQSFELVRQRN